MISWETRLSQCCITLEFLDLAYNYAVHLKFLLSYKTSRGVMTSCEFLTGRVPDLSHVRTWGCKTWVLEPRNEHRKDWHAQSVVGWFAGISEGNPTGWIVWCPEYNDIVISVNVTFDENIPEPDKAYHEELKQLEQDISKDIS